MCRAEDPPYRPVQIFLQPNYLARTLTAPERLECHFHNYAYLCETFSPAALLALYGDGVELFSRTEGEVAASCRLTVNRKAPNQGELSLNLMVGGEELYALGFSFVPARSSAPRSRRSR